MNQKSVYVVLGMARSGTSAITRGLHALGIDLGDEFGHNKTNKWNPTGIWEDKDIVYQINRRVAKALGDTWISIHLLDDLCRHNEKLTPIKQQAIALLTQRLQETTAWAFKDPRTSRLLPFWQEVFEALTLNEHYIIALRNPLASAHSWQTVSGVDVEVGLLQWLIHLIPAIEGMHHKKCVIVSYDLLLENPSSQLRRIHQQLAIPTKINTQAIDAYGNQYLNKKLHHFDFNDEDLSSHPAISMAPVCGKIYQLLMRVAKDEISLTSHRFLSEWEIIRNEFNTVYPIYSYLNILLKQKKELEREIRAIHRSLLWKCSYPIRYWLNKLKTHRRLITLYGSRT